MDLWVSPPPLCTPNIGYVWYNIPSPVIECSGHLLTIAACGYPSSYAYNLEEKNLPWSLVFVVIWAAGFFVCVNGRQPTAQPVWRHEAPRRRPKKIIQGSDAGADSECTTVSHNNANGSQNFNGAKRGENCPSLASLWPMRVLGPGEARASTYLMGSRMLASADTPKQSVWSQALFFNDFGA